MAENVEKVRNVYTANFKPPAQRKKIKVNLYDPHEDVPEVNDGVPGPGHYFVDSETEELMNLQGGEGDD
jgi:hypothetical protein